MRELVGHQTETQVGAICAAHLLEHRSNRMPQLFFRRGVVVERLSNGFVLYGSDGLPEDFGVQAELVAEVIVNGGDVRARARAYLTDSRVIVADFGEDLSRGVKQLGASAIGRDRLRCGL